MPVFDWILLSLATVSVVNILVNGTIFESTRGWIAEQSEFLGELFTCYLCLSVWTAPVMYGCWYIGLKLIPAIFAIQWTAYILYKVMEYIELKIEPPLEEK